MIGPPSPARRGQRVIGAVCVAGFLVSPALSTRLDPNDYAGGRSRAVDQRVLRNTSSAGIMLGELRTAMSDIMYIKTERYLHSGIAYLPHMQNEILSVDGAMHCRESEDADELIGAETVIRRAGNDFRGFIGALQREVKPYRDPGTGHAHSDGDELLPWFRVMTLSDPHYLPGYTMGSWWLKSRDSTKALDFAEEGLRHNPEAFQLHMVRGQILLAMARKADPDPSGTADGRLRLLRESTAAFHRATELALAQRPRDPSEGSADGAWTPFMEDDVFGAARMSALMECRYGNPERGTAMAGAYLHALGEDPVLLRLQEESRMSGSGFAHPAPPTPDP